MMKLINYSILVLLLSAYAGCKKEADLAPVADLLGHKVYSVTELQAIATCTNNCNHRFTGDVYFIGVVVADEQSGNFYKELYLRDRYNTGGIHLDLLFHSGYLIGDSIRIDLKGLDVNLNANTGMLEIDSLDHEKYTVRFASGSRPQPRSISISDLNSNSTTYMCDLVQINNVGFLPADADQYWSDPIGHLSLDRTMEDCNGSQLIVRTSNYAKFGLLKTPTGNGSIIGIATAYKGANQLAIRSVTEADMNGAGCTIYLKKDFEDNSLTSGGWTQQSVTNPAVQWAASSFSTDKFAKISGYVSGNTNSENWLISPALNLSASSNPVLTFRTAAKFSGDLLEVLVSTNYTSGSPGSAMWTSLSGFSLSPNNPGTYAWTASGNISLSTFKNANTRIAFKYKSTTAGSTTYEVDDVIVKEN
jgi:hypothetical protein